MTVLTLEQILEDVQQVTDRARIYPNNAGAFFSVLQFTGCRINELCNFNRWGLVFPNKVFLETSKRGGTRYFNVSDIDSQFMYLWSLWANYGSYMSVQNMRRIHNTFTLYPTARILNKDASVHMFRHAKIKKLYYDGVSVSDIATQFGYSDVETAQYYIDSIIYLP